MAKHGGMKAWAAPGSVRQHPHPHTTHLAPSQMIELLKTDGAVNAMFAQLGERYPELVAPLVRGACVAAADTWTHTLFVAVALLAAPETTPACCTPR